mmetsp:Transcript_32267/g.69727  ORF Transcript_32267/g.69727 Transcript_32267/m.69727 type:complete len:254 (-) Transcript_32267:861-1622(-)
MNVLKAFPLGEGPTVQLATHIRDAHPKGVHVHAFGLGFLDELHELGEKGHSSQPRQVQGNTHLGLQLRTHGLPQALPRDVHRLVPVLQEEAAQPAAELVWQTLLPHHGIQVRHLLAEGLRFFVHVADDGAHLTQDIGPAESSRQNDHGAHHPLDDVAGENVAIAYGGHRIAAEVEGCEVHPKGLTSGVNPKGGIGIFHIINPGGDLRLRLGIRELESHGPDAREPMAHDQQDEEEANQRELLIWDRHRNLKLV